MLKGLISKVEGYLAVMWGCLVMWRHIFQKCEGVSVLIHIIVDIPPHYSALSALQKIQLHTTE